MSTFSPTEGKYTIPHSLPLPEYIPHLASFLAEIYARMRDETDKFLLQSPG